MATYHDLNMEWSALCQDCPDCWTKSDLQLAAELGKTLLERNKELESTLKQYQNVIDDQTQEIEYLTKQTVALREVNDSRLRIYEQLEVSIQDLERANHRLAVDNATDKKQIKVLTTQIETLETKCDELQATVDELRVEIEAHRRKAQRAQVESETIDKNATSTPKPSKPTKPIDDNTLIDDGYYGRATYNNEDECDSTLVNVTESIKTQSASTNTSIRECDKCAKETNAEEVTQLLAQLKETRSQIARDQKRITELQEQIETYDQRTQSLEKELFKFRREDEAKNMQEELITLEEVRQGQICSRCLRTVDSPKTDDMSSIACDEPEEDDNSSMMEALCNQSQFRSSFAMDVQDYPKTPPRNLYKEFVEKYEALVEISCNSNLKHNSHINSGHTTASKTDNNEHSCPSLQEELRLSNDFRSASVKDTDDESGHGGDAGLNDAENNKNGASNKKRAGKIVPLPAQTPTDFSEAETSSSGFSDETSNKATQTDMQPGSFLCTIVDGAESISIYDDASPIESRFRNRPEYRELFKEIFTVLKKAAVNKDEDEELPKLDDNAQPVASTPKVPPVTPSTEPFPDFPDSQADDTQSVLSSTISELSLGHFDPPTLVDETLVAAKEETDGGEIMIQSNGNQAQERVLKPLVRQPLEYISVAVSRKRSSSRKKRQFADRSDSPVTHIVGSPKITYSNRPSSGRSRRREYKSLPNGGVVEMDHATTWNGNTLQFWSSNNRNVASPTPRRTMTPTTASVTCRYENGLEFKPSAASQDLYKLKRLDLSYAEVLRNGDVKKKKNEQNRFRRK